MGREGNKSKLLRRKFLSGTHETEKMGREGNKSKLRTQSLHKRKPSCGRGGGGLEGGCGAQEKA